MYPKIYYHKERLKNHNKVTCLTLILLTWRIWRAPNNASRWQMGFNSVFKGLKTDFLVWRKNEFKVTNTFWDVLLLFSRRHYSSEQLLWQRRIIHIFKWGNKNNKIPLCILFLNSILGAVKWRRVWGAGQVSQYKTNKNSIWFSNLLESSYWTD